jgi:pimeloyl-ACP methyl ester carboxylesterase
VVSYFSGRDGARLAYREVGTGRPLILLHGLMGDGTLWLRPAETIATHDYRVILPDFRGHGESAKPHDSAAYPPDILTDDAFALLEHLDVDDYDLGGYSLGARIAVRLLVRGATPRRAVIAGQGLREVLGTGGGAGARLRQLIDGLGAADSRAEEWFRSTGEDPEALLHVLDSIVATPVSPVAQISVPTLVAMGVDDERSPSADELVALLPHARRVVVPGNHATAVAAPELVTAITEFLRSSTVD